MYSSPALVAGRAGRVNSLCTAVLPSTLVPGTWQVSRNARFTYGWVKFLIIGFRSTLSHVAEWLTTA